MPNYREPDPELGNLNLSTGGSYPVEYALRLAAGFGSQIAMSLLRRTPVPTAGVARPESSATPTGSWITPPGSPGWTGCPGTPAARLEVDHRRLRVVDVGAPPDAGDPPARRCRCPTRTPASPRPRATGEQLSTVPRWSDRQRLAAAPVPAPAAAPVRLRWSRPAAVVDPMLVAVTRVVAEMTGYPAELLDPDLDLEADLGVDTVKQAEVFAAVREEYGLGAG